MAIPALMPVVPPPVVSREREREKGAVMEHCLRCHGLMYPAKLCDSADSPSQDSLGAFRCTSCGDIVDEVILTHRLRASAHEGEPSESRSPCSRGSLMRGHMAVAKGGTI